MKVKIFLKIIILISLFTFSFGVLAEWAQCGGSGWTGDIVCDSCCLCYTSNKYYSQCLKIGTCGKGSSASFECNTSSIHITNSTYITFNYTTTTSSITTETLILKTTTKTFNQSTITLNLAYKFVLRTITDNSSTITKLNSKTLLSGSPDGNIASWDISTGEQISSFNINSGLILAIEVISNSAVISSGYDYQIFIFNPSNGSITYQFPARGQLAYSIQIIDNSTFAIGYYDGYIHIYDNSNKTPLLTKTLLGQTSIVKTLVSLPNLKLASLYSNDMIAIWNLNSGTVSQQISGLNMNGLIQINNLLIYGSQNNMLKIYNMSSSTEINSLNCSGFIDSISLSKNGLLYVALSDGGLSIFDSQNNNFSLLNTYRLNFIKFKKVEIISNNLIATTTGANITIWDFNSLKPDSTTTAIPNTTSINICPGLNKKIVTLVPRVSSNIIGNTDSRVFFILKTFNPSWSLSKLSSTASNRQTWGTIIDAITSVQWLSSCESAKQYYNYLEDELVLNKDSNTWVTYDRLTKILPCKTDCNFNRLLSVQSYFTNYDQNDKTNFIKNIVKYLPPLAASNCRNAFPATKSGVIKASDLVKNIAAVSFMSPAQIGTYSPDDSVIIAKALTSSNVQLSLANTKNLGSKIPVTQSLVDIASIASGLSLTNIKNTNVDKLAISIKSMDLNNMNSFQKAYITTTITSSKSTSSINTLLSSTKDSSIINSVPKFLFSSLSRAIPAVTTVFPVSNFSASNLPVAYLISYGRSLIQSNNLTSITDLNLLSKILPSITKFDIANITDDCQRFTTIVNLLNASLTYDAKLNSNQRSIMLQYLISSLKSMKGSSYLSSLTIDHISVLYPLFLEASATTLYDFSQLNTFSNLIFYMASIATNECCRYALLKRALFASYAVSYLFNYTTLQLSDLYQLGPCLSSVIPINYLSSLDPDTFVRYFPYIGNAFQPDYNRMLVITSLITSYALNNTLMNGLSQDDFVFSKLSHLALFYPFSTYSNNLTTWKSNGPSLLSIIMSVYDTTDQSIQQCRLGLDGTTNINSYISNYKTISINKTLGQMLSLKRATSSLTCDDLVDLGSQISSLSSSYLSLLDLNEYYKCQTLLGLIKTWSSSQLTALASIAKSYYGTAFNISDLDLISLNSIMQGFSSTDLVNINFNSTTSLITLGSLNGWNSSQLTALAVPVTNYINNSLDFSITIDFVSSAANLLCCLSQSQIQNLTTTIFDSSVPILSKININCPNMQYWYELAKTSSQYGPTLFSSASSLTELGSIIAGMPASDALNVPSESIYAISTSAWNLMPASTVNSFSSTQISGLSNDQLTALVNSPSYSSFSNSIVSNVQNQLIVSDIVSSSTTSKNKSQNNSSNKNKSNYFVLIYILLISVLYEI